MSNWLKTYGKVIFDVDNLTKKHQNQSSWKSHVIAFIKDDLDSYYRWFLKKKYNIDLIKPIRGSHFTIVNDKTDEIKNWDKIKKEYNEKSIEIWYNVDVRSNTKHWWLKAFSKDADIIRNKLGLSQPFYSPHITIGLTNKRNIQASNYAIQCEKLYGNLSIIKYPNFYKKLF
jgi:hypothetical protein